jgi:hypothetical protein
VKYRKLGKLAMQDYEGWKCDKKGGETLRVKASGALGT